MLAELDPQDTIAAIASATGPGLRGIVRLSGPDAWSIALAGFQAEDSSPLPRRAEVRRGSLQLPGFVRTCRRLIALWPAPRTYTGQDVAEIHTTGAVPLLDLLLADCLRRGARHAQPGEFTLRAFLCGRIDLTRAEAVLGVIDAHNPTQLDAALRQLAGGLSGPLLILRDRLLDLVAHLEANLDFVDEADVDPLGRPALAEELDASASRSRSAGPSSGPPRPAGHCAPGRAHRPAQRRQEPALQCTPRPGSRDRLAAGRDDPRLSPGLMRVRGMTVELIDTAGDGNPGRRGLGPGPEIPGRSGRRGRSRPALLFRPRMAAVLGETRSHRLTDASGSGPSATWVFPGVVSGEAVLTSAETGNGSGRASRGDRRVASAHGTPRAISRPARARDAGTASTARPRALGSASRTLLSGGGEELVAFDLRLAIDELGKVLGAVVTDDILDRIFQRFCIGK